MFLVSALHMFSVSYFTGNIKITTTEEPKGATAKPPAKGASPAAVAKDGQPAEATDASGTETEVIAPKRPTCSPEQKVKVTNAINAYVAANASTEASPTNGQDAPDGQDSVRAGLPAAHFGQRRLQLTLSAIRV